MTNGEKYKTAKERRKAFMEYIVKGDSISAICEFAWLDLEAEEEKPMPCPFCGSDCVITELPEGVYYAVCRNDVTCTYCGGQGDSEAEAIAAHNRVCKAVAAYKESEVK